MGRDFNKLMLGLGRLSYFIVLIIAKETITMIRVVLITLKRSGIICSGKRKQYMKLK